MRVFALLLLLVAGSAFAGIQKEFYVSAAGSDSNPGTLELPFQTLARARDAVRTITGKITGDIVVYLRGGDYQIAEPVKFGVEDSGRDGFQVIYRAFGNETPVISGGVRVNEWVPDINGIWKARLQRPTKLRQLYVNSVPAKLATMRKRVPAQGGVGAFVVKGDESWALASGTAVDGVHFKKTDFPTVARPTDLELESQSTWTSCRVCVREMKETGDGWDFLLEQPMAAILQNQGWGTAFNPKTAISVFNAYEFVDEPGEFYFNRATQTLYYLPRPGEQMSDAEVIAPVLETLVDLHGCNLRRHVSHLRFEGITFAHSAWQLMRVGDSTGAGGLQSCALSVKFGSRNWHDNLYQTTDIPAAAVEVNSADHISFRGNTFKLTGCLGLNLENDVCDASIEGNVFHHIGECSINVGHPQHVYIGRQDGDNEGHGQYHIDNRYDKWGEDVEGLCTNVLIANNLIRRTGEQHSAAVALSVIYGHNISIVHNDLKYAPYTGISLGWGWEEFDGVSRRSRGKPSLSLRNNRVCDNRIANMLEQLADGGGIYLLGMSQPPAQVTGGQQWSDISGNYIHDFGRKMCSAIHPDNGSRFFYFHDNVFENMKWLHIYAMAYSRKGDYRIEHNYSNTEWLWSLPGRESILATNTVFLDNMRVFGSEWPAGAGRIMANSGLEPAFRNLLESISLNER